MGCWMRPMDRWMVNFRGKPWEKPWVLTQENPWESPLKILTNTLIMDLGWMLVGRCCLFSAWSFSAFQEMCVFRGLLLHVLLPIHCIPHPSPSILEHLFKAKMSWHGWQPCVMNKILFCVMRRFLLRKSSATAASTAAVMFRSFFRVSTGFQLCGSSTVGDSRSKHLWNSAHESIQYFRCLKSCWCAQYPGWIDTSGEDHIFQCNDLTASNHWNNGVRIRGILPWQSFQIVGECLLKTIHIFIITFRSSWNHYIYIYIVYIYMYIYIYMIYIYIL